MTARAAVVGARLLGGAVLLAVVSVVVAAEPAGAHGLGGISPTNYQSRLITVTPRVAGIEVEVVDLGNHLELTNHTGHDVVVIGYDDEPYLRVGPHAVFENLRSPATYLNRTTTVMGRAPARADPSAVPEWHRVSSSQTARWHDHRIHYMGTSEPPVVQRDSGARHVVGRWSVPIVTADGTISARGEIVWVPGPSPWPWVAISLGVAALLAWIARTRWWQATVATALAAIGASETLHVIGLWGANTASAGTKLAESAYSIGGVLLGVVALVWTVRRGPHAAAPIVLVAAVFLLVAGGLADLTTLGRSQIPSTLPAGLARALVTANLGLGAGLVAAAAMRLRPQGPAPRPSPGRPARSKATAGVTN